MRRRAAHAAGVRPGPGAGRRGRAGWPTSTAAPPCGRCGSRSSPRWCWSWWPRSRWRWSRCRSGCGCSTAGSTLRTALLVLLLAPEAYLPLRAAGTRFHASMEGLAALDEALTSRPAPAGTRAAGARRDPGRPAEIRFDGVTVAYDRTDRAARRDADHPARRAGRADRARAAPARAPCCGLLLGFVTPTSRAGSLVGRRRPGRPSTSTRGARGSPGCRSGRTCSPGRWPTTSGSAARTPADAVARRGARRRARRLRRRAARRPGHRARASAGTACPAGSGSGSRWPGRSCAAAPVVLLDEPTARLDAAAEAAVLDATAGWSPAAPRCSSRTGRRCSPTPTGSCASTDGVVTELTPAGVRRPGRRLT